MANRSSHVVAYQCLRCGARVPVPEHQPTDVGVEWVTNYIDKSHKCRNRPKVESAVEVESPVEEAAAYDSEYWTKLNESETVEERQPAYLRRWD